MMFGLKESKKDEVEVGSRMRSRARALVAEKAVSGKGSDLVWGSCASPGKSLDVLVGPNLVKQAAVGSTDEAG